MYVQFAYTHVEYEYKCQGMSVGMDVSRLRLGMLCGFGVGAPCLASGSLRS